MEIQNFSREELKEKGYKTSLFSKGFLGCLFIYGGCLLLPIFGPVYLLYVSIRNFLRKKTDFFIINKEPIYVSDKRYKSGVRQDGYKDVKVEYPKLLPSTQTERYIFIIKGIIVLMYTIWVSTIQYNIATLDTKNNQTNPKDSVTTIQTDTTIINPKKEDNKKKLHKTDINSSTTTNYYNSSSGSYNHVGKRGGVYHYSKSGKKVYSKKH